MNTISGEFRQEIEDIWSGQIADDPSVKAVVFISGKPDNYIAGADIRMISSTKDKADLKKVRGEPYLHTGSASFFAHSSEDAGCSVGRFFGGA